MAEVLKFENTTKASQEKFNNDEQMLKLKDILSNTVAQLNELDCISAGNIILYVQSEQSEGFVSAQIGLSQFETQVLFLSDFLHNTVTNKVLQEKEGDSANVSNEETPNTTTATEIGATDVQTPRVDGE